MTSIFQVLTMVWTLQGGQYIHNGVLDDGVYSVNNNYFFDTEFEVQLPLSFRKGDTDNVFVGSDMENQFFPNTNGTFNFSPWQDTFTFKGGIRFMGMELGYNHQCVHPIVFDQFQPTSKITSSFGKVYLKVSGSF